MDRNTVKVYVTNIENQGFDTVNRETRIRHKVSFRLEWPVRALVLEHHVSTYANQENAVERTYPSVVSYIEEIRKPERIELQDYSDSL